MHCTGFHLNITKCLATASTLLDFEKLCIPPVNVAYFEYGIFKVGIEIPSNREMRQKKMAWFSLRCVRGAASVTGSKLACSGRGNHGTREVSVPRGSALDLFWKLVHTSVHELG